MTKLVKLQPRYGCHGPQWYLENDEGDLTWVAPMVKEHIERLEAENANLRKDNDRLIQAVEDLHDVKLEDQLVQLENENAKLRKLVSDAHSCKTNDGCCEDCYCDEGCCPIERRMQELGIEEDE